MSGKTYIEYGSIDPNGKGYIYKIKSDSFIEIEAGQWVSEVEAEPVEIFEIKVRNYWDTISFAPEALRIQKELYGRDKEPYIQTDA